MRVPEAMDSCISQTGCRDKSIPSYLVCATACHMEGMMAEDDACMRLGATCRHIGCPRYPPRLQKRTLLGREHRNAQVAAWADRSTLFHKICENRAQTWCETD